MYRVFALALAVLCLPFAAGDAQARVFFQFADSSGTAQSSFEIIGEGNTVDIQVYLVEDGLNPNPNVISSNGDLTQAGIELTYSQSNSVIVESIADITPNAAFDAPETETATSGDSSLIDGVFLNSPVAPDADGRILVGTFTFTAQTGSFGDTVTITTSGDPTGTDDNVTANNTVLDSLIGNASITVSVVPEPSSMLLCGFLATGLAGCGLRRLRRRKTQEVVAG